MGYTTEFLGRLEFSRPLSKQMTNYINDFSTIRHMKRDNEKIKEVYPNWKERCFFGYLGDEGEFFISNTKSLGQDKDDSVLDYNEPSLKQPGLWCQWIVSEDGKYLMWDRGEKFYNYIEWLEYIIENFVKTQDKLKVNGYLVYMGEDVHDIGIIEVKNNMMKKYSCKITKLEDLEKVYDTPENLKQAKELLIEAKN